MVREDVERNASEDDNVKIGRGERVAGMNWEFESAIERKVVKQECSKA